MASGIPALHILVKNSFSNFRFWWPVSPEVAFDLCYSDFVFIEFKILENYSNKQVENNVCSRLRLLVSQQRWAPYTMPNRSSNIELTMREAIQGYHEQRCIYSRRFVLTFHSIIQHILEKMKKLEDLKPMEV